MHCRMVDHIVGEVARGVLAATVLHGMADQVKVFLQIDIERRNSPAALGGLGFLLHIQDFVVAVKEDNACTPELVD